MSQHNPKPTLFYLLAIYRKISRSGSTTRKQRKTGSIWYRVWHFLNCCRMRNIPWYYNNHCLPEKSLCSNYSLSLHTAVLTFLLLKSSKGRAAYFLGWRPQQVALEYKHHLRCQYCKALKKYRVKCLFSVFSGFGECFALGYVYLVSPNPDKKITEPHPTKTWLL